MKRRTFALAVPAGLAVLTACSTRGGGPEPAPVPEDLERAPVGLGETAEEVDPTTLRLPLEMTVMIVVAPGWTSRAPELDGIFLGWREEEDRLRFIAAAQDGTLLWQAERPLSCTGFALGRGADGAVAVLADSGPEDDTDQVATVSGFELETARELWGPVDVPGPQAAPGLVFAAADDEDAVGDGPRIALSARTGEIVLDEDDLAGGRILAEHLGAVVHTDGEELIATSAEDGEELWRSALPTGPVTERLRIDAPIDSVSSLAVLVDPESTGVAIDLSSGETIAEDAGGVARDHATETTVVAAGTLVLGLDAEGREQWRHEDPESLVLLSAGERLAYAQRTEEGSLVVLDASQGTMIDPYDADQSGPLGVPEVFSSEAAACVRFEADRYLVTTTLDENYGLRE